MEQVEIREYLDKKKDIQNILLEFIDDETNNDTFFQNLIKCIENQKITESPCEFKEFIRLVQQISNHHYRTPNFFQKIEQILLYYKENIQQTFSNNEIFDLFKSNKKNLYFVTENHILKMTASCINVLKGKTYQNERYFNYLFPLIHKSLGRIVQRQIENQNMAYTNFDKFQKIGENEQVVCQFIRSDSIDAFTSYYKAKNKTPSAKVEPSIFETHPDLIDDEMTLLEYAAFFGAIKIFKFLLLNDAQLSPLLWLCAIHSRNIELIHLLESQKLELNDDLCIKCFHESIKCHHNEIAEYFLSNYCQNLLENPNLFMPSIKFCNYSFFPTNLKNENIFYDLCKFNFSPIIAAIINDADLKINAIIIHKF